MFFHFWPFLWLLRLLLADNTRDKVVRTPAFRLTEHVCRCNKWKIIRNVYIVWGISGLWHGASWHFVCWGLFQQYDKKKGIIYDA